jgi:hypothetical protein
MVDKAGANKAKNAANIAFKAKDFDKAIEGYNTAVELDPGEVTDQIIHKYLHKLFIQISSANQLRLGLVQATSLN